MIGRGRIAAAAVVFALVGSAARAQGMQDMPGMPGMAVSDALTPAPLVYYGGQPPVMDNQVYTHALLDQFEARIGGGNAQFRYDGQAWSGTDTDKLWLKSEGLVTQNGQFVDGDHEVLYDHAVTTYFDVQAGLRSDLDNGTTRNWAAFGVQGLLPYFFDLEATAYASDGGHFAARLVASYDILLTNRLILQPQAELNFYSAPDPGRGVGAGFSSIDSGLRLRYEITRKFAPYIGIAYEGAYGATARYTRAEGLQPSDLRLVFGLRLWY